MAPPSFPVTPEPDPAELLRPRCSRTGCHPPVQAAKYPPHNFVKWTIWSHCGRAALYSDSEGGAKLMRSSAFGVSNGRRDAVLRTRLRNSIRPSLRRALRDLWNESAYIEYLHRSGCVHAKRYLGRHDLRLNLGCGSNIRFGWVNVDLRQGADLRLDLRRELPFGDGSACVIYSEHFFEHLEYPDEAGSFLQETYRVLAPGGLFRVGVPDTEWPVRAYTSDDSGYFDLARERGWHPGWCQTRMQHLNYHFRVRRGEHKYAYDFETLAKSLAGAGFISVERAGFDSNLDSARRELGTLYVTASK